MIEAILIPFTSIFLAELMDKSQLIILLLSTKTKKHWQLLFGAISAFILVDGFAIFLGAYVSNLLPGELIRTISGLLFIFFGILSFRRSNEKDKTKYHLKNPFLSALSLVFVTEWGDKTQLASAVFAAEFNPIYVFIGIIIALSLLSWLAIKLGSLLFAKMKKQTISKISGTVFILLGLFFLFIR